MAADGAPFTPLSLSVLRFTGIQSYGYTDQRKVEADVEVTEDRTGDLALRKPHTGQLSHDCFFTVSRLPNTVVDHARLLTHIQGVGEFWYSGQ